MTISTPTVSGQILTSAYVNNNINSGLVYINSGTASTASSIQIDNCFTSDYDNYRVTIRFTAASTTSVLYLRMVNGTTPDATGPYYGNLIQRAQNGTEANVDNNAGTAFTINSWVTTTGASFSMNNFDVMNPQLAQATSIAGTAMTNAGDLVNSATMGGTLVTATAYEGLQILTASGTFSGVMTVYGYRKP